jgi:hypothetical protein
LAHPFRNEVEKLDSDGSSFFWIENDIPNRKTYEEIDFHDEQAQEVEFLLASNRPRGGVEVYHVLFPRKLFFHVLFLR